MHFRNDIQSSHPRNVTVVHRAEGKGDRRQYQTQRQRLIASSRDTAQNTLTASPSATAGSPGVLNVKPSLAIRDAQLNRELDKTTMPAVLLIR